MNRSLSSKHPQDTRDDNDISHDDTVMNRSLSSKYPQDTQDDNDISHDDNPV